MALPEVADRPNFSQTCSRLSRYLKAKGSFGELGICLTPKPSESIETVDFLPLIENSGDGNMNMDTKGSGQMTIFYAGQVIVLEDLPADKANEVMLLASMCSAIAPQPSIHSDLPIARKNSVACFLEKRKDRITAQAPYQARKPAKIEPWLGLAPQLLRRH